MDSQIAVHEFVNTNRADSRRAWFADLWRHREVVWTLTRKDFQTRYKRASFGVLWAVAVPALQAAILALVFSRVVRLGTDHQYPIYVMAGVVAYSYFSTSLGLASTAIVEATSLTDKVWFPRVILVAVPCLSGFVGFFVTVLAVMVVMPLFHVGYSFRLFLLVPATVLLFCFTFSISSILSALYVYFRDVKYLVQAALMVWIYLTPVLYSQQLLGRLGTLIDANPLTGIVDLFHEATVGGASGLRPAVTVSVCVTCLLAAVAVEVQRRFDRLFVDLL